MMYKTCINDNHKKKGLNVDLTTFKPLLQVYIIKKIMGS
jgi:hypothetical protein